jgi:Trp operon repressor
MSTARVDNWEKEQKIVQKAIVKGVLESLLQCSLLPDEANGVPLNSIIT